jgi:hypothetical protein
MRPDQVQQALTWHRHRCPSGAAILGMIPIAPTVFWGPMAYAVMVGLLVATLLTLVFLPITPRLRGGGEYHVEMM